MNNLVAIVGRPNVGKSTLFNRITGKQLSIVEDTPGVTRDRIYSDAEWNGKNFVVVDTGGLDFDDNSALNKHIQTQAQIAIDLADAIIFVFDGRNGLTKADYAAVDILRKSNKPVYVCVNKIDNNDLEQNAYEFYSLGFKNLYFISAIHGRNVAELLDDVVANFSANENEKSENEPLKIALIGKPNAGKSSIINKLLGENRLVVSNVAGTTRDSVDTVITYNKEKFIFIDTAGIRKKSQVEDKSLELYSVLRSFDSIRRADVVVYVIDATENVTDQDLKLMSFVDREGKPSLVLLNKWDLVDKNAFTINTYLEKLKREFDFLQYLKFMFVSAETGKRLPDIFDGIKEVYANSTRRISTGTLNEIIHEAFRLVEPPTVKGSRLKLLYVTEPQVSPPTFVFFVNNAELAKPNYVRYLENYLRKSINFDGTPIRLNFKSRKEDE